MSRVGYFRAGRSSGKVVELRSDQRRIFWPVDRRTSIRLPDADLRYSHRYVVLHSKADAIVKILGEVFRRRVDLVKRRQIVDEFVIEIREHSIDQTFQYQ